MKHLHLFHIPVMGVAYTIDTPLKVSQYGIDSVISLVDNVLLEKMRKFYSEKFNLSYNEISQKSKDYMAERITAYLNLINRLSVQKFEEIKNNYQEKKEIIKEYFELLPDNSYLRKKFNDLMKKNTSINEIKQWVKDNMQMGSIDVNIMTKVDKTNYKNGQQLPHEFNDAHAALRGYANSDLTSSLVLSAGMSPRLYSYIESFEDFYPNADGFIKKKIILKVSDYRSAFIQGKFLAKKGIWVSEFRIESGLNCGGHAFATDGFLMGPILEEFKNNRYKLREEIFSILTKALEQKGRVIPNEILPLKITAQGGVGTSEEQDFLIDYYNLDSIGWGSPFLLVPEVTTVDEYTRNELSKAKEKDLYLSEISPLGVPFNSLRTASATLKKLEKAKKGRAGSSCPKAYLVSNTEFTEKPICTASRQYQNVKLKELENMELQEKEYQELYQKIITPECLCVGLSESAIITHKIDYKIKDIGVSVCPGPNMAYFHKTASLKEMITHIYGKTNLIGKAYRPNIFVKELNLYIDYLKKQLNDTQMKIDTKQIRYFKKFAENLQNGLIYYFSLFENTKDKFAQKKDEILKDLSMAKKRLEKLYVKVESLA